MTTPAPPASVNSGSTSRFDTSEGAYLGARTFLLSALAVLWFTDIMRGTSVLDHRLYLAAYALLAADTAVLVILAMGGRRLGLARAMMLVLAPDLVGLAVFTYLGRPDDSFYVAIVLIPIFYALVVSRRNAVTVGVLVGAAYGLGVAFIGALPLGEEVLYLIKIAIVPVVTFLVANAVSSQRSREEAAEAAAQETEQLNEQLRNRVHELQAIAEVTDTVHSSLDFDRVGPKVLEIVASVIGVETCCLFVIDKEHSETLFSASRGTTATISDPAAANPYAQVDSGHLTCIPVFDHGSSMVLFCASSEELGELTAEDRIVLATVAGELVVAVENSRLYKLTSRLAVTDELTGLANYRHLQQRLDEEIPRSARYSKCLSLLMLDADDFKAFNDAHGHVAGDVALAELGPIMKSVVREVDVVARYGGEEFSVILPETDVAGAYVVAEKIREAVQSHRFADEDGCRTCEITVSIGLATYPVHAGDKDGLLRGADDALYHAKSGGKNRVRSPQRHRAAPVKETRDPEMTDEWTGA